MPNVPFIGLTVASAVLCGRFAPLLMRRLRDALGPLRYAAPAGDYRSQTVTAPDHRAPLLLAVAAQALLWLIVVSALRVGSIPFDLMNLIDEPHRQLGLVPDDASLLVAHVSMAVAAVVASLGAWRARAGIVRLTQQGELTPSDLRSLPALRLATLPIVLAGVAAMAACLGMIAWTPMSLYWLDRMALQSAIYAIACGVVSAIAGLAIAAAARWRRTTL